MRRLSLLAAAVLLAACPNDESDEPKDTDTDLDSEPVETDLFDTADTGDTGPEAPPYDWPDDPEDLEFGHTTYLSSFDIPELVGGTPTCCRDWGAASKDKIRQDKDGVDNALALIQATVGGQLDLEAQLDATVEDGAFAALLEHADLPEDDGTYNLGFFLGFFDDDTTYADASVGNGYFRVDPQSFVPGTGRPVVQFPSARVTDGHLVATGGNFTIPLAFGVTNLDVVVKDVRIEADLVPSATGVTMTGGELSGYIRVSDFFGAYNDLVSDACACAGLSGPLFEKQGGTWQGACMDSDTVAAACGSNGYMCAGLIGNTSGTYTGFCGLLGTTVPFLADIDVDGDPDDFEALSVGLEFVGVPATVSGLLHDSGI